MRVNIYMRNLEMTFIKASWRNGSAFDSRSKGYPFKSGRGQNFFSNLSGNGYFWPGWLGKF
ncbi:hypothetical protein GGR53DRAFT_487874 [Hypoxylon sp. FL1150]|nr:hypothetical protein GGR53DRAFT_487874 [Hypoxylon sp. FL1150]